MADNPQHLTNVATTITNNLLAMPNEQRIKMLSDLKQSNVVVHDLVVAKIKAIRDGTKP